MGYTNYWYQHRNFTDAEWSKVQDYYYNNLLYHDQKNSEEGGGQLIEDAEVNKNLGDGSLIMFNGKEESCETFVLYKNLKTEPRYDGDNLSFHFCKTKRLPYDELVWDFLQYIHLVIFKNDPQNFVISNDDGDKFPKDKLKIVPCENGVGEWEISPIHETFDTKQDAEERLKEVTNCLIASENWVGLYAELSDYVERRLYPNRKTHNDQGERLEETEDDFLEIVDDIEEIMGQYLTKEEI